MFGLFRRKKEEQQHIPLSLGPAAPQPEQKEKAFSVSLSWKGLFGLLVVFFILQMWMFFLGMWAAQTIVFPTAATALPVQERQQKPAAPLEQPQKEPSEPVVIQPGSAQTPQ